MTAAEGAARHRGNNVLLVLVVLGWLGMLAAGFVSLAPNRLTSGRPLSLWTVTEWPLLTGIIALGAGLLAAALWPRSKALHRATALIAAMLLLLLFLAAGRAGEALSAAAGPVARISLGTAFWLTISCTALAIVDSFQRMQAGPVLRIGTALAICACVAVMAAEGVFDALSIMVEYRSHQTSFAHELARHGMLVLGSVGAGLAIGVPLGIKLTSSLRLRGPIFGTLNLLQTVPSVALFGLLIAPLSLLAAAVPAIKALGIEGIGAAPALIALTCYALLPIVRYTYSAFSGVDPVVIEAGLGVGFTRGQILWRISLPLATPVLLAGLRIVLIQSIGLAVVAALIGAGGLGTFVFQGIGQDAVDLVLLGTLPTIFLALATDFTLKSVTSILQERMAP
jgi:osmoprotectant transport system permease protein